MLITFRFFSVFSLIFIAFSILGSDEKNENLEQYQQSDIKEMQFDKAKWESIVEDLDYPPEPLEEKKEAENADFTLSPTTIAVIKHLSIGLVIGVLSFLVFKILSAETTVENAEISKREQTAFGLEEAAQNIHQADLDILLKNALDLKDFRLAIRVYYLLALKHLSSASLIDWKKDKTNAAYISELLGDKHYSTFQQLTISFERAWYGNLKISEQEYNNVAPVFQNFLEETELTAS